METQMADPQSSNTQSTAAVKEGKKSSTSQIMEIYKSLQKLVDAKPPAAEKAPSDNQKKQEKINIFGPRGVGKTRIAKKISERATREKVDGETLFDFTIWAFMCCNYTKDSLCKSIARQLFIIPANEEWEVESDNINVQDQDHDDDVSTENLVQKIKDKLKPKDKLKGKDEVKGIRATRILVVLDDVSGGKTKSENETTFWSLWEQLLSPAATDSKGYNLLARNVLDDLNLVTLLISIDRSEYDDISPDNAFEIKPLPREVCNSLLEQYLDTQLGKKLIDKFKGDNLLARNVNLIAKVLVYFGVDSTAKQDSFLETQLMEASESSILSRLLCNKHDVLPIGVLKDLWWKGDHFFRDSGSVHYSELILYWILEGYLGVASMTKLYQKGHGVLMELVDCGVVKPQEGGYVFIDNSVIDLNDLYQNVDQNPNLGLGCVITSEDQGFGRITHNDGMLKTTPKRQKKKREERVHDPASTTLLPEGTRSSEEEPSEEPKPLVSDETKLQAFVTTLLLDGTRFSAVEIERHVSLEEKLEAFCLFCSTVKSLPKVLEKRERLRVLILRGCEFLEDAKVSLKHLEVLEISGGRILRRLNSSFFKYLSNLKSLHLSGLQIRSLPQAIYNLEKIKWFIVKDCPRLKKVESISKLVKLIVVDLSGNISLDTLDKNFLKFEKLQSLNLSNTLVSTTPLLKNRKELTHLLCRDCKEMDRLRGLTKLTNLQTIDLKGSTKFEEFHDSSLESLTSLITLNLSETVITRLPFNISKPRELYLERCLELRRLPCTASLENLEVLSLSGSKNLVDIEDSFFDDTKRLQQLNLSKTGISKLPSFSNLSSLRKLDLSHCRALIALPSLESATNLEVLDASNCIALQKVETKSFESMTRLQKIDFSNTNIDSFPSLPKSSNLHQLLLKNCKQLQNLQLNQLFPKLEELNLSGVTSLNDAEFVKDITTLRILDLSYTSIKQLPSMSKLTNLTHLSVAGCIFSSEPNLDYPNSNIQVLDLSNSSIKTLPNLKNHTNLKRLMLKGCSMEEISNDYITGLEYFESPKEVDQDQYWNICELSDEDKSPVFRNATQFLKNNRLPNTKYHCCAVEGDRNADAYAQRHELVFRDVYLQTSRFVRYKDSKSLQLRGFEQFPNGIEFENIVKDIELVFLIDYKLKGIPLRFNASMLPKLKGCWIERCNEIVAIFDEKEPNNDDSGFDIPLEDLALCNNKQLKTIYGGKQPFESFDSLKSLYIDNCPELKTVFSSSWLPKNLELLEIKYCGKMIDFGVELPESLQTLKIWECPRLLQNRFEIPKSLKVLWISGATSLKNFVTKNNEPINLETLKVENCSMLEYVMSSSSQLACVEVIDIRLCEKMKTLCTDIDTRTTWLKLRSLHLEHLPMLKQIGADFKSSRGVSIFECPNLQHQNVD